ncbi:DUF4183 domain-containing protein [Paenibacillus sp. NPDC057967]|uniref:DUF4183 domain-containing protein n=1 Tax=Paenibacillus sp. NPDC057967 TaxID=3346293 RepID=UPI0036D8A271
MKAAIAKLLKRRRRALNRTAGCRSRCRKSRRRKRRTWLRVYYYYAQGDGVKRSFWNEDATPGYKSRIPARGKLLLANVFVDGMLQAPELYHIAHGGIQFQSDQPPPVDSRIIAQFIVMRP